MLEETIRACEDLLMFKLCLDEPSCAFVSMLQNSIPGISSNGSTSVINRLLWFFLFSRDMLLALNKYSYLWFMLNLLLI